jgi:hypothetical protein
LLEAGFIRPVDYPSWLANYVLIEKSDGSWRMCIDYISLNKACPKDEYPLPRICQIINSTASCELLSFLDAYSGYHHIILAIDDEEKNVHHTIWDLLLHQDDIRAEEWGATYQKCIHIILEA